MRMGIWSKKYHYNHFTVDARAVVKVCEEELIPWCKTNGLKLLIVDNDTKFHTKQLCTVLERHGIQMYPGSGKKPWDRRENGYPPRSHDCMPAETEFANAFEEAQLDVERREKNLKKSRTMLMWHHAIEYVWQTRPIKEVRKLIEAQPGIMFEIIDNEGERTSH